MQKKAFCIFVQKKYSLIQFTEKIKTITLKSFYKNIIVSLQKKRCLFLMAAEKVILMILTI